MEKVRQDTMIQKYWRPAMAWSYLCICLFDFILAPILNAIFQAQFYTQAAFVAWVPITLGSGGLYHISMMAIVGVTAYSRGQEKIKIMEILTGIGRNSQPIPNEPTPIVDPLIQSQK